MLSSVRRRRLLVLLLAAPAALMMRCVGDDSTTTDGGKDVAVDNTTSDGGGDVITDANTGDGSDGFTCNLGDAAPGSLDFSFSAGPKALGSFSPNAAAVDSQGRIYVAGTSADCGFAASAVVHRFNADGSHDGTFGGADAAATGVCIHYDNIDTAYAVAVDSSGAIVVGGLSYGTRIHATVTRLTSAGAFDTTFNTTGKVDLNPTTSSDTGFAAVQGVAFFANKIVVTGSTEAIRPGVSTRHTGFVARLNNDGSSDTSFANGLYKDTTVVGYYGVVVSGTGVVTTVGATVGAPRQLVVRRLDVGGVADGTFGDAGALVTLVPTGDGGTGPTEGRALMLSGTHYVIGLPLPELNGGDYATGPSGVLAVTTSGAIDTTFGTQGGTTIKPLNFNIGYQLTAFAPECDGKILFGSRFDDPDAASNANQDIGISRLLPTGAIDTGFGSSGVAHFIQTGNEIAVAVAQDPSTGRIVVVGANQTGQPVLARFNP